MARDPPKVPRKQKTPPESSTGESGDESDNSSLFGNNRTFNVNELLPGDPRIPVDDPGDPQDDDDDDLVDMKVPAPERNDRAVIIPWYQAILDISEEVAQTL